MDGVLRKSGAIGSAATLAGGAAGALLLALASPAGATGLTYTVDSLADGVADPTHCSDAISDNCTLRDAIEAADLDQTPDTVVFTAGLTGTITLTQGELEIGSDLSVVGPGAALLAVSGNNASTVFYMCANTGVEISGLTMTNGNAPRGAALYEESCSPVTLDSVVITGNTSSGEGGAIFTQDDLTIRNSIVTNNTGGTGAGMYVDGDLVMEGTVVSGNTATHNGGGVYVTASASITTSTIEGNIAGGAGGGVDAGGSVTIENTTLSGNSAVSPGGGLFARGTGKSILVANSTVTGNSGSIGGGLAFYSGNDITLAQDTIVANSASSPDALYSGGGVHFSGPMGVVELSGTIASGNTAAAGPADIGFGNASLSSGSITATNSLLGAVDSRLTVGGTANINSTDPGVGALADNGGPTRTMALLTTSAALDAGPVPVATFPGNQFDQRGVGFPRVQGTKADIGAIEGTGAPVPPTPPTPPEPVTPAFTG
jgi:predicted outer membrane repeat protein